MEWINVNDDPIPMDTDVLVYLEQPSLGRHVHSANFKAKGISIIGHYFAWDLPKPLYWMPLPEPPKN